MEAPFDPSPAMRDRELSDLVLRLRPNRWLLVDFDSDIWNSLSILWKRFFILKFILIWVSSAHNIRLVDLSDWNNRGLQHCLSVYSSDAIHIAGFFLDLQKFRLSKVLSDTRQLSS